MADLDYARYGRQIALPEIGAKGQQALAREGVRFVPAFGADAVCERTVQLYRRAGGTLDDRAEIVVRVPNARTSAGRLGVAAFHAIEAARRVLGQPAVEFPEALLEHLDGGSAP